MDEEIIKSKKEELQNAVDNEKLNEISQDVGVVYSTVENNVVITLNKELNKETKDLEKWKQYHLNPINKNKLKNQLEKIVSGGEKAASKVVEASRNIIGVYEKSRVSNNIEKGSLLVNTAMGNYNRSVAKIERLESSDALKESIYQQTKLGIEKGIKVVYQDGKTFRYKTYMEMAVRTNMANEVAAKQLKYGANAGIVFYLYNSMQDCAKDHQDYQGQYYYDARWESFDIKQDVKDKIAEYIASKNMMSVQEVEGPPIYLGTRPNCRHKKISVSIEQVLGTSADKLENELGISYGYFIKDKYIATSEHHKNERNIREYRDRMNQYKELAKQDQENASYKLEIIKNRKLIKKWEAKDLDLRKQNQWLKRDKRREYSKILVNDIGAKYNVKL